MTSSHVLLAVLLSGYSTIAVLSARAVLRERRGRRRKHPLQVGAGSHRAPTRP
ncbi:hypothetical protein ACQPZQ_29075 [Pseudonocardia sp. CA-142604]|uniref:hypothetical protein n=1 Tax=Pseudonocardia sp. CA-142604 TaxID=3240024 RepID=UPI003D8FCD2A